MNKFLDLRLRRFVPVGLIALAAAVLLAPAPASATPYVVKLVQQGSNVVATGSGELDLTGLSLGADYLLYGEVDAGSGYLVTGAEEIVQSWSGATGPGSFGAEADTLASTGTGDMVGIYDGAVAGGAGLLYVPFYGYVSGDPLSTSSTWDNATFASLGLKPGTYVWSWGSAPDQSFTLDIVRAGPVGVPEPTVLGMFGFGVLLIGGFMGLRRRAA